jgi:hypothetical protein
MTTWFRLKKRADMGAKLSELDERSSSYSHPSVTPSRSTHI